MNDKEKLEEALRMFTDLENLDLINND